MAAQAASTTSSSAHVLRRRSSSTSAECAAEGASGTTNRSWTSRRGEPRVCCVRVSDRPSRPRPTLPGTPGQRTSSDAPGVPNNVRLKKPENDLAYADTVYDFEP